METENIPISESETDFPIPQSYEVDDIIEFYKNLESDTEDESDTKPETVPETKKKKRLFSSRKKQKTTNGGIHSEVYGLSEKGRMMLYRTISLVISCIIIVGAFVLAYYLPGNESVISEQQDKLREDPDYASLKSRYDALKTEVENLENSNKDKKEQIDKIADFDNTKAELRTQITAKTYELSELNGQIEEKRKIIAELEVSIAEKTPPETILPPGKYQVGKNIAAGKYQVTGTGKFMVATASGKSKNNTTLGSTPLEIHLDQNDIVKFDSKVKFTSLN